MKNKSFATATIAVLVEEDRKGYYKRYALTVREFADEFINLQPSEIWQSETLKPCVHISYRLASVGDMEWKNFFKDMTYGLPESDVESGNLAYVDFESMNTFGEEVRAYMQETLTAGLLKELVGNRCIPALQKLIDGKPDSSELLLANLEDYFAYKLWQREDIAESLKRQGYEASDENIDLIINNVLKSLCDCSEDWQVIDAAVCSIMDKENAPQETVSYTCYERNRNLLLNDTEEITDSVSFDTQEKATKWIRERIIEGTKCGFVMDEEATVPISLNTDSLALTMFYRFQENWNESYDICVEKKSVS